MNRKTIVWMASTTTSLTRLTEAGVVLRKRNLRHPDQYR